MDGLASEILIAERTLNRPSYHTWILH
jgi:hypothetical protein